MISINSFKLDSCATAKCGPHKRCVIRSGQPKCVCAPKCKAMNRVKKYNRPKYDSPYPQKYKSLALLNRSYRKNADERQNRESSPSSKNIHRKNRHQHVLMDATTPVIIDHQLSDVSVFFDANNSPNRTNARSDKMISIVAPPSTITNLSSHRFKKRKTSSSVLNQQQQQSQHNNGKSLAARKFVSNRNSNLLTNNNNSDVSLNDEIFTNEMQHTHRRHRINTKNNYGSNITSNNRNHYRHNSNNNEDDDDDENNSWSDRIRSGFYGHDIPYPPIDVPVSFYIDFFFHSFKNTHIDNEKWEKNAFFLFFNK